MVSYQTYDTGYPWQTKKQKDPLEEKPTSSISKDKKYHGSSKN